MPLPSDDNRSTAIPLFMRQAVKEGAYNQDQALEVARLPAESVQRKVANEVKRGKLSLLQTRQLVEGMLTIAGLPATIKLPPGVHREPNNFDRSRVEYRGGFDYAVEQRARPRRGVLSRLLDTLYRFRRPSASRARHWSDHTTGSKGGETQISLEPSNPVGRDASPRGRPTSQ